MLKSVRVQSEANSERLDITGKMVVKTMVTKIANVGRNGKFLVGAYLEKVEYDKMLKEIDLIGCSNQEWIEWLVRKELVKKGWRI